MPIAAKKAPSEFESIRTEITALTAPLSRGVQDLGVSNAESFTKADVFLTRINNIRNSLMARVKGILDPLDRAKKEIDASRREITLFRDDLSAPLDRMESAIRLQMKDYKLLEQKKIQEEEGKKYQERKRLEAQAAEVERQAAAAKTAQLRAKLENKALDLSIKALEAEAAPSSAPVTVAHSTTRKVRKVEILSIRELMAGVAEGVVPEDVIDMDTLKTALERHRRLNDALVNSWPGVRVVEDIQIVRR